MEKIMVNLYHACTEIDVWAIDTEEQEKIARGQGYVSLKELRDLKEHAWKMVELKEGNELVFVGVHAVAWKQEWGEPKVGFDRWSYE